MTKIDFTGRITARKKKIKEGKENVGFKTISQIYILSLEVFSQNMVKDERKKTTYHGKKERFGNSIKVFRA